MLNLTYVRRSILKNIKIKTSYILYGSLIINLIQLIIIIVHCMKINKLNVKLKRETNKFLVEKEINEKIKDNSKYSTV